MVLYINDSIPTNTNIEQIHVYMRASGASELRKFWHFYILKLLFLSIFCRYIRYFVGTNDMLVGLHVPTNFQKCTDKIIFKSITFVIRYTVYVCYTVERSVFVGGVLKVLGKSVGLCKTSKRKDQLYISLLVLYGESSVKISTQTDSY